LDAAVPGDGSAVDAPPPPFVPAAPVFPRLTASQYRNAVLDLLGGPLPPVALEPDTDPFLFVGIGAARASASARDVSAWEDGALTLTRAIFDDPTRRMALVGCAPTSADDGCARGYLLRFGRRALRRPLEPAEADALLALARQTAGMNPWQGVRYATAAVLQLPSFLYRVELGEPDPARPGRLRYTAWEMASRLAFTLWNSIPDEALLAAAERGTLVTEEGVRAEARRMLRHPRARAAVRAFFSQYLGLARVDGITRDPTLYPQLSPTLPAAMREEIERVVEDVVFTHDEDFRGVFNARSTFLNAELARLYGVPMAAGTTGFVRMELPEGTGRGGILTAAGVLALTAHPNATSPTARGRYVRERLLCERVPDPPGNVNLDLGEADGGVTPTLRERLERHRRDPACAGCHARTDPVGLGFEDFDALGARRATEGGRPVDARGDLDGQRFDGARALGALLARDGRVARCITRQLFRYASARIDRAADAGEQGLLDALTARFAASGYRFQALLVETVASEGFRTLGPTE
jgi:hypothetical protein